MGELQTHPITRSPRRTDRLVSVIAGAGRIIDLPPERRRWFTPIDAGVRIPPGARTADPIRIPQADANRLLRGLVRFVADIPADTSWLQPSGDERLTLQTSTGPNRDDPRFVVIAGPA